MGRNEKSQSISTLAFSNMVGRLRLERRTNGLKVHCSTD